MTAETTNVRLAVSALIAMLFTQALGLATALAGRHPMPELVIVVHGAMLTAGVFALPLVWWRTKTGYACAIAVGVVTVLVNAMAAATGLPLHVWPSPRALTLVILQLLMSALVVVSCVRAWHEPTSV